MNIDIKNLPLSSDLLRKMIIEMSSELAELNVYKEKYERLVEELRLAKQQRFAPSSEKNILQPDFFDEAGTELPDEPKDDKEKIEIKPHTRSKHPIRRPLPDYLEREDTVHDISDEEKVCSCGVHLVRIGEEVSEQLKYIPSKLNVIRHVRPKYACKHCQENVKIAKMPKLLLPKCIATPELVAYTIVAKYCDHIPLYRQSSIWTRMEIELPRSSLCGWLLKVSALCEPLIKELQKIIVSYDYVQSDETTVQVLNEEGRENTTKSYMWCYRGGGEDLSIVYEYQETRGGYHAREFLSGFKGYLQSDAFSGYNWAHDVKEIISIGCNAHARRPFAELAKLTDTSGLATMAIKFYRQLYAIEKEARDKNYTSEKRYSLRKERSEPILKEFKEWLDRYHLKTSEQGKIGKAIRYCLSHWAKLTGYLKDGRIEIDNNLLENAIRPFALGRKNWLFAGSPTGAKAGAIFYSLIETCKANNVEPYRYFCSMLNRIRECENEEDYPELLPQYIDL
ncbi:MAG: IS66 family transposase [Pseudomonadota bacterium]|nr:IS66 family transposase [Pseudomonadota bacterium]